MRQRNSIPVSVSKPKFRVSKRRLNSWKKSVKSESKNKNDNLEIATSFLCLHMHKLNSFHLLGKVLNLLYELRCGTM